MNTQLTLQMPDFRDHFIAMQVSDISRFLDSVHCFGV